MAAILNIAENYCQSINISGCLHPYYEIVIHQGHHVFCLAVKIMAILRAITTHNYTMTIQLTLSSQ